MAEMHQIKSEDEASQTATHNDVPVGDADAIEFAIAAAAVPDPEAMMVPPSDETAMSSPEGLVPISPPVSHEPKSVFGDAQVSQGDPIAHDDPQNDNNESHQDEQAHFDADPIIFHFGEDPEPSLYSQMDSHQTVHPPSEPPADPAILYEHAFNSAHPPSSSTGDHDAQDDAETGAAQVGRVDASSMGEVKNPLQKSGRHTVITGHLPDDDPYSIAVNQLGIKMVSLKMMQTGAGNLSRDEAFKRDLHEFLLEINHSNYKVPVIGGGPLNLYKLTREVLLLGGVQNVVKKRAFRIVGQQLELPKSCTSAAFVLKNAYSRLLFHYEQKLVHDILPENPSRNINIKMIVSAEKEREKQMRNNRTGSSSKRRIAAADERKRRMPMPDLSTGPSFDAGELEFGDNTSAHAQLAATVNNAAAVNDMGRSKRARMVFPGTGGAFVPENDLSPEYYMSLVTSHPPEQYELPAWARQVVQEQNYQAFVDAAQALDEKREVKTGVDVVLVAIAHCFESSSAKVSAEDALAEDRSQYCLLYRILRNHSAEYRPAFSMIFDLLGKVASVAGPGRPVLAHNEAAIGLFDALLLRLDLYRVNVVEAIRQPSAGDSQESRELAGLYVTTAFCSASLLHSLVDESGARQQLANHPSLVHSLVRVLAHRTGLIDIEELVWDVLERIAHNEISVGSNGDKLSQWLAQAVVSRGVAVGAGECKKRANLFARRGLCVLNGFARRYEKHSQAACAVLDMIGKILGREGCGVTQEHFAQADFLSYTLISQCGWQARAHAPFISSLIWQLSQSVEATFGAAGLVVLHRMQPLAEFSDEFIQVCDNLSTDMLDIVREIVADYFVTGVEIGAEIESPGSNGLGGNTVFDEMVIAEGHGDM